MYRIRFHGRGGQGIKTASRILGTAFFQEGFEVQDAPLYGAERRGAPVFAFVRASRTPIHERGVIRHPDLVVAADETLVGAVVAGVTSGVDAHAVLLLHSEEAAEVWRERLRAAGKVITLPSVLEPGGELRFAGAACAAAAARLLGVISREALERALCEELAGMEPAVVTRSLRAALEAWERLAPHAGCVREAEPITLESLPPPGWVELPFEGVERSAPDIHGAATSVQVRTGLWRTMRPVVDREHYHRCTWICTTLCPDGVPRPRCRGLSPGGLRPLQGLPRLCGRVPAPRHRRRPGAAGGRRGAPMSRRLLTGNSAAAATGVRVFSATSSQGLLYGMEMLYTVAGWRAPFVLVNVSRGLSAPITLEPDHQDVLAARDSGFLQIHCSTCQEVLDGVLLAYRLAEDPRVRLPAIVNLDGFHLSFTREPVEVPDPEAVDRFLPAFDPGAIRFRASRPISQAVAVLGGAPYSYFRYEMHRAAENALGAWDEIAADFEQAFGRHPARSRPIGPRTPRSCSS